MYSRDNNSTLKIENGWWGSRLSSNQWIGSRQSRCQTNWFMSFLATEVTGSCDKIKPYRNRHGPSSYQRAKSIIVHLICIELNDNYCSVLMMQELRLYAGQSSIGGWFRVHRFTSIAAMVIVQTKVMGVFGCVTGRPFLLLYRWILGVKENYAF